MCMMADMNRTTFLPFLLLVLVVMSAVAAAQTTVVRFGVLVCGKGQVVRDATVVIEGDRIARVGSREIAIPSGARMIDLHRFTGIPGMIDVHTHMTYYWDLSLIHI